MPLRLRLCIFRMHLHEQVLASEQKLDQQIIGRKPDFADRLIPVQFPATGEPWLETPGSPDLGVKFRLDSLGFRARTHASFSINFCSRSSPRSSSAIDVA